MRITIVTDGEGKLIASMHGHASSHRAQPGPFATLRPRPDQVFHEVSVPDDYGDLAADDLHRALQKHLPQVK